MGVVRDMHLLRSDPLAMEIVRARARLMRRLHPGWPPSGIHRDAIERWLHEELHLAMTLTYPRQTPDGLKHVSDFWHRIDTLKERNLPQYAEDEEKVHRRAAYLRRTRLWTASEAIKVAIDEWRTETLPKDPRAYAGPKRNRTR